MKKPSILNKILEQNLFISVVLKTKLSLLLVFVSMDNKLSLSTEISLSILRFRLLSDIVFLRYVLTPRRMEKEHSAVMFDTGIMMKILNRKWMFGKIVVINI